MLELKDVTKIYGARRAVDGVTFRVPKGALTGFVGANGAGKTTTMRVVLGIVAADSGTVCWEGVPVDAAVRRRIGYMPEERGLYPRMSVAGSSSTSLACTASRRPPLPGAATSCSNGSTSASAPTTRSTPSRWATSSAPRSRQPWSTTRTCCCSTSRSAASTPSRSTASPNCSASWPQPASPCCSPATSSSSSSGSATRW